MPYPSCNNLPVFRKKAWTATTIVTLLVTALVSYSFGPGDGDNKKSPPGYGDLSDVKERDLPKDLAEISGMVYDAPTRSLYAITDDDGWLYNIPLDAGREVTRYKFHNREDFEGLARVGNTFYVIVSNGDIVEFAWNGGADIQSKKYKAPFSGPNEFESLYYDASRRKLVILCKDCHDEKKASTAACFFDLQTRQFAAADFRINTKEIKEISGKKGEHFRPSAAALHPLTGELYILSAINNLLVVADRNGNVKQRYKLDPKLFKQPEGIAFTPSGDLIISNEAAGKGDATLLVYSYKR